MRDLTTKNNLSIFAEMVKELAGFDCGEVRCNDCPFHMVTEDSMEKFGTRCGRNAIYNVMSRTRTVK